MVDRNRDNQGGMRSGGAPGTSTGSDLPQQAAQVKEQIQQQAAGLKDQVKEQATGKLEEQKSAASDGLTTVAHAIRQTGEQLRGQQQEGVARYIDRAAAQVEQFAGYLGGRDVRQLARDAEQFARREPAIFLGGALTLGLLAGRFLKSSGAAASSGQGNWRGQSEWYGQPVAGGGTPRTSTTSPMPTLPSPLAPPMPGAGARMTPGPAAGTAGRAGLRPSSADAIVGGPPIDDVIVGGPPINRSGE